MANIAAKRIKREFKEVMKSEEVRLFIILIEFLTSMQLLVVTCTFVWPMSEF